MTATPPASATTTLREGPLSLPARLYVGGMIAAGSIVLALSAMRLQVTEWKFFLSLLALSCLASTLKIRLPLTSGASTMSISYVVDFTALLLLGPTQTVFIAASSAVTQTTFNVQKTTPFYRTLFNIAAIVITIEASGQAFSLMNGGMATPEWPQLLMPLMAAATTYYLINTLSVSIAIALTSGQSLMRIWNENFQWCAPSYFVGAGVAQVSATIVNGANQWVLPALVVPVYLTFRSYKVYLGRLENEQKHAKEVTVLHAKTQYALKKAQMSETRLRETLDRLKQSEQRYALAAEGSNDGLWDWDVAKNRIYFSPRWRAVLGLPEDEAGATLHDWLARVHPDDADGLQEALSAHLSGITTHLQHEHRVRTPDGTSRWMLCRGIAVRDAEGTATRIAGSQTDVTDFREAHMQLEHAAAHDSLTNLPNRATFMRELERVMARGRQTGKYNYAVVFVDLDRFKLVNDSLGHLVGDQLLMTVAKKLASCLRVGDVLARLGGDEFTILFDGVSNLMDVKQVAERIQWQFREPLRLEVGNEVFVTTSIGIAMGEPSYQHPQELLRDADTAMYRAKAQGKACHVLFESKMREQATLRLRLDTELRRAIEHNELKLVYQPVIAVGTRALTGFEALLRWQRADGEIVPPSEFIPLAEETGVIVPVGLWALNEACRQAAAWNKQFRFERPLTMSVNISPRQLMEPGIFDAIRQLLKKHDLPEGTLALEITESALAGDATTAMRVIERLKTLPIQVLLDDFGTGYSSLGHLHRFPVDTVKIDRSFLGEEATRPGGPNVLAAVVSLARNLGKGVVVEGVETAEHAERIERLRCAHAQGFYYAKPMDVCDATQLVVIASASEGAVVGDLPEADTVPVLAGPAVH